MDDQIKSALMQVVAPVFITAIASLITVLINTITKIAIEFRNYNAAQYELMQKFYPKFKTLLIDIKFSLTEASRNTIYIEANSMAEAVHLLLLYREDESKYIELYPTHIDYIVELSTTMEDAWNSLTELSTFLRNTTIPAIPMYHPILKNKVHSMLAILQYFSLLIAQYQDEKISTNLLEAEIKAFPTTWEHEVNPELISEYLKILDTWLKKF